MSGPPDEPQRPSWQQPEQQPPPWQQPEQQWQQPQQQQQWGQQPYQQGQWQPSPPTPGAATAALILGICGVVLGFCLLGWLCAIPALILGYKGRNEIDNSGGRLGGRGQAVAGIVLGWVGIAISALWIVLFVIGIVNSPG
jgi:hypothetical protein